MPETEIDRVALRILKYLIQNPGKKDTLTGICEWWLLHERFDYIVDMVNEALEDLVSRGLIVEKRLPKSEKVYQINAARKVELSRVFHVNLN
ncbi:MAG: hypothetical protein V2J62_07890 [candidate division KSB1 bacterium]|jgi:hypothetical protein|nr:hypothetical protein [candidate division KSB1 bacterium]